MVVLGRILVAQVCQRFSRGDMIFRRPQPFGAGLVPGKQHGVFVFGNARIQGAVAFGRTATPQFRRCTESAVDEDANVLRPNRGPEEFVAALEDVAGSRVMPASRCGCPSDERPRGSSVGGRNPQLTKMATGFGPTEAGRSLSLRSRTSMASG